MEKKHTPGEWSIAYEENGRPQLGKSNPFGTIIFSDAGFGDVALVIQHPTPLGDKKQLYVEQMEANAKLIAAAPDLLNALQSALTFIADLNGSPGSSLQV